MPRNEYVMLKEQNKKIWRVAGIACVLLAIISLIIVTIKTVQSDNFSSLQGNTTNEQESTTHEQESSTHEQESTTQAQENTTREQDNTIDEDDIWMCANSQKIDSLFLCDGTYHCEDGSDEDYLLCRDIPCSGFKCTYGGCVAESKKCNGIQDCVDNSDEYHPDCFVRNVTAKCKVDEFACDNGECIDSYYVCDGLKTCSDESDETVKVCGSFECNNKFFKCKYGACIAKNKQCNGVEDCIDNSDELGCPVVPGVPVLPRSDHPCHLNKSIKGTPYVQDLNITIQGYVIENMDTVRYVCDNNLIQLTTCKNGTWIGDVRCDSNGVSLITSDTQKTISSLLLLHLINAMLSQH